MEKLYSTIQHQLPRDTLYIYIHTRMQTRTWKIGDFIPSCFTLGEKGKVSLEQESFYSADTRFLSWSNRWKFSTGSRDMNVNSEWDGGGPASICVWKNNSFRRKLCHRGMKLITGSDQKKSLQSSILLFPPDSAPVLESCSFFPPWTGDTIKRESW